MTSAPTDPHQATRNAEKWERTTGVEARVLSGFRSRLQAQITPLTPATVLDAGCGEGTLTGWLAARLPAASVQGVELRADARTEFARRNPEIPVHAGDLYALPFDDDAVDLVVAFEVHEHLEHPDQALRELGRVSARAVAVTVPWEPFFRLGNLARGRHTGRLGSTPGHLNTWGRHGFSTTVARALPGARWFGLFPWQGAVWEAAR